jgi:MscS family membrane protein
MTRRITRRALAALGLFLFACQIIIAAPASAQMPGLGAAFNAADDPAAAENGDAVDTADTGADPAADAASAEPNGAIDPAEVGLAGLPARVEAPRDVEQALAIIDERIAALDGAAEAAGETAAADDAAAADPAAGAADPRIEVLRALRREVQRHAALIQRRGDLEAAIARRHEQLDDPAAQAVNGDPPYPITLLDQLLAERGSRIVAERAAARRLASAERGLRSARTALAEATRARRALRDRLVAAEERAGADGSGPAEIMALERALEAARLEQMLAHRRLAAAGTRVEVARAEGSLADAEAGLLGLKIEHVEPRAVLDDAALAEQLERLGARTRAQRQTLERLEERADAADSALYEARRARGAADGGAANGRLDLLDAEVDARMAEVTAARQGIESVQQTLDDIAAMEALWRRRHAVLTEPEAAPAVAWQQEAEQSLTALAEGIDYLEGELNALRDLQLKLDQRLADAGLDDALRAALERRAAALAAQETHARALLAAHAERRALLTRLREHLAPLAGARSLAVRLRDARAGLSDWWSAELFVIDDQGVTVRDVAVAAGIFLLVLAAVPLAKRMLRRLLERRRTRNAGTQRGKLGLLLDAMVEETSPMVVLVAAFALALVLSGLARPAYRDWLWGLLVVALYVQIGLWVTAALSDYFMRKRSRKELHDPSAVTGYGLLLFFLRAGVWIIVGISVLAWFRYPIAGLIGALGIGGIAVAFAVQSILGDVFNSLAIILDKPFRVGDFIVAGETLGVIENIGVKTTRIRSLSGEQVIVSNTDLLKSRIHNYKQMRERRVAFRLGITYETPRETLERVPGLIAASIREQADVRFDRAHFFEYGAHALVFEVVYYVLGADYNLYMDRQQGINFSIHRRFQGAGVAFAYPTQEIILRRGDGSEPARGD